jgi:hypothetical protein
MPPLNVKISGDATPLIKELNRAQMLSSKFATDVTRRITSAGSGVLNSSRSAQVANEIAIQQGIGKSFTTGGSAGGGGFGTKRHNAAVAGSMFTSIARDSAASLASGAPITQVIAQQAPQALQALQMMRMGMVGVYAVGVALAGVLAYKVVKGLYDSYTGAEQLREGMKRVKLMTEDLDDRIRNRLAASVQKLAESLNAIKLAKSGADYDQRAADAAADLEKAFLKNEFLLEKKIHTKEEELELEKQLLAVDLKRAIAAADIAKKAMDESEGVASAKLELEKLNQEYNEKEKAHNKAFSDSLAGRANPATGKMWTPEEHRSLESKWGSESQGMIAGIKIAEANLSEAQRRNGKGGADAATAKVFDIQNQILSVGRDGVKINTSNTKQNTPDVNDMQRRGHWSVGNSPLLDVNKAQLQVAREQLAYFKARRHAGNFGGN